MAIFMQYIYPIIVSFIVLICWLCARRYFSHNSNKPSRISNLESKLKQLEKNVNDLEDKVNSSMHTVPTSTTCKKDNKELEAKGRKQKRNNHDKHGNRTDEQTKEVPKAVEAEPVPTEKDYIYLTISDGKLVEVSNGKTAYYRAWKQDGKLLFELFCDSTLAKKVINNRAAIIDPCCLKDGTSVEPDLANIITTIQFGELDANYNIKSKTVIKFS